jgi:hypothetical protein
VAIKKAETEGLVISPLKRGRLTVKFVGDTPLYFNAMSAKARRDLLVGGSKKTTAERKELKHDPEGEFFASLYRLREGPTLLGFPAPGVKAAMATAALETPGITKTSVQRLVFLPQEKISIWGIPELKQDVVRSADMNRTPDIRTRAFLPEWCAEVQVAFVEPTLTAHGVTNLLVNAGMICGIGDFRQEKGKGGYGTFRVVGEDDAEWTRIAAAGGRDAQQAAVDDPEYADEETAELMAFLHKERIRRAAA